MTTLKATALLVSLIFRQAGWEMEGASGDGMDCHFRHPCSKEARCHPTRSWPKLVLTAGHANPAWAHLKRLAHSGYTDHSFLLPSGPVLRGLSIGETLLHFSLGCPHQDPGAILPPFRVRGGLLGQWQVSCEGSFLDWSILLLNQTYRYSRLLHTPTKRRETDIK